MLLLLSAAGLATAQDVDLNPQLTLEAGRSVEWTLASAGDYVNIKLAFPAESCVPVDLSVTGTGVVQTSFWFDVGSGANYWTGGPVDILRPTNGEQVYTGSNSPLLILRVDNVSDTVRVGPDEFGVEFGEDATIRVTAQEGKPGPCQ